MSTITAVRLEGSIQSDVPVKPVWPTPPAGKRSPRLETIFDWTSQPSARRAGRSGSSLGTGLGSIIRATAASLRILTPWY